MKKIIVTIIVICLLVCIYLLSGNKKHGKFKTISDSVAFVQDSIDSIKRRTDSIANDYKKMAILDSIAVTNQYGGLKSDEEIDAEVQKRVEKHNRKMLNSLK
jgi:hypothetical protein